MKSWGKSDDNTQAMKHFSSQLSDPIPTGWTVPSRNLEPEYFSFGFRYFTTNFLFSLMLGVGIIFPIPLLQTQVYENLFQATT